MTSCAMQSGRAEKGQRQSQNDTAINGHANKNIGPISLRRAAPRRAAHYALTPNNVNKSVSISFSQMIYLNYFDRVQICFHLATFAIRLACRIGCRAQLRPENATARRARFSDDLTCKREKGEIHSPFRQHAKVRARMATGQRHSTRIGNNKNGNAHKKSGNL